MIRIEFIWEKQRNYSLGNADFSKVQVTPTKYLGCDGLYLWARSAKMGESSQSPDGKFIGSQMGREP